MATKLQCIVCGKSSKYGKGKKVKLPHGSFNLCHDQRCLDTLNYHANNGAVPVVWFSMSDFIDHELVDEKIIKSLAGDPAEVTKDIAREVGNFIWGGETLWHDALEESAATVEELYVKSVKDKQLPLIDMSILQTKEGKELLEKRLKGK